MMNTSRDQSHDAPTAEWEYTVIDGLGATHHGFVEAPSKDDAIEKLRGQGYYPTALKPAAAAAAVAGGPVADLDGFSINALLIMLAFLALAPLMAKGIATGYWKESQWLLELATKGVVLEATVESLEEVELRVHDQGKGNPPRIEKFPIYRYKFTTPDGLTERGQLIVWQFERAPWIQSTIDAYYVSLEHHNYLISDLKPQPGVGDKFPVTWSPWKPGEESIFRPGIVTMDDYTKTHGPLMKLIAFVGIYEAIVVLLYINFLMGGFVARRFRPIVESSRSGVIHIRFINRNVMGVGFLFMLITAMVIMGGAGDSLSPVPSVQRIPLFLLVATTTAVSLLSWSLGWAEINPDAGTVTVRLGTPHISFGEKEEVFSIRQFDTIRLRSISRVWAQRRSRPSFHVVYEVHLCGAASDVCVFACVYPTRQATRLARAVAQRVSDRTGLRIVD